MSNAIKLFCCGCKSDVTPRLVTGKDVYPHRADLHDLPFWKCDGCGNFVGCHHKTKDRTRPLGIIATKEIKAVRQEIHRTIDPLWLSGRVGRREVYEWVAHLIGVERYHTAEIRSVEQGREVLRLVKELESSI